ncbi:hypothetical protein [Cellulomonas sp. 73-92]|uniref:hypothetical protein n=1 Tax=Cellulomonas sp. 73-92 TaxID=1895740 RepID=UPI000A8B654B|nr:hypothetical protein [Cellulomonas sp. 73-92]
MSGRHAAPRPPRRELVLELLTAMLDGALLYGALALAPAVVRVVEWRAAARRAR